MFQYRFTAAWGFLVNIVGPHCDELGLALTSLNYDGVNQQWIIETPVEWPSDFVDHLRQHETAFLADLGD